MAIKIYWNDKTIFLCSSENELTNFNLSTPSLNWFPTSATEVSAALQQIAASSATFFALINQDHAFLLSKCTDAFQVIEAAGGVVTNHQLEFLCIFRRGKWDLPKGKMEQHETAEICAAREIEEETGVNQLTLHHKLTDTYHVYEERGLQILKISHWFYFTTNFNGAVHPQLEEDITAIKWYSLAEFEDVASKNTFDAIQDVVDTYKRSVLPFI